MGGVPTIPSPDNPRWRVSEEIAAAVRRRWAADVLAIGAHGALAHGDDADGTDVDLAVVTYKPGAGPRPGARRIDGVVVDLGVIGADEYLQHARTLSTSWPFAADQYLTASALWDPDGWFDTLRDTHLSRLAEASGREFAALARQAWCHASALHAEAGRLAGWYDTDGAVLVLGEARRAAAGVEGLLTRTYFRSSADAVRRTGLGDATMDEVAAKLAAQAAELQRRGRPVDGTIDDLLT